MSDHQASAIRAIRVSDLLRQGPATGNDGAARAAARIEAAFAAGAAEARSQAETARLSQEAAQQRRIEQLESEHRAALEMAKSLFDQAIAELEKACAESLASLAITIARAILATEPHVGSATLASLLGEALGALPESASGTIAVPPNAAPASIPAGWRLTEDPALAPGTLRARVDASTVTASLERRLAQLADRLASLPE